MVELEEETKQFIIEKATEGYEDPEEIELLLREERNLPITPSPKSIGEFLESEKAQKEIETKRSVKEKKADVTKQDLLEELVDLKDDLNRWHDELKDTEHGVTRNEAVKNIISTLDEIGKLMGEIETGGGVTNNVVKVDNVNNYVKQNFNKVVKHMGREQKRDIVEELKEDEDIEDFVIKRK